jgi:hypothetical protein
MHMHRFAFLLSCCMLAACGGDKADTPHARDEDGLPKPAAAAGSVTGMPNPGVAAARPAADAASQPDMVEFPEPLEQDDLAAVDPADAPAPIGNPVPAPESTMPVDPHAPPPPPPPPEETANRVQQGNPQH